MTLQSIPTARWETDLSLHTMEWGSRNLKCSSELLYFRLKWERRRYCWWPELAPKGYRQEDLQSSLIVPRTQWCQNGHHCILQAWGSQQTSPWELLKLNHGCRLGNPCVELSRLTLGSESGGDPPPGPVPPPPRNAFHPLCPSVLTFLPPAAGLL